MCNAALDAVLRGVGGGRDKLVLADGSLSLVTGGRVHSVVEGRGAGARIGGASHKQVPRGMRLYSCPRAL